MQLKNKEAETLEGEITRKHPAAAIDGRPVLVIDGTAYGTAEINDFQILKITAKERASLKRGKYAFEFIPPIPGQTRFVPCRNTIGKSNNLDDFWFLLRSTVEVLDDGVLAREAIYGATEHLALDADWQPLPGNELDPEQEETLKFFRSIAEGKGAADIRERVLVAIEYDLSIAADFSKDVPEDLRNRLTQCLATGKKISFKEAEKLSDEIHSLLREFECRMGLDLKAQGYLKNLTHYETSLPG